VNTSAAYVPFLEHRCPAASDTREERTIPALLLLLLPEVSPLAILLLQVRLTKHRNE
jgi:hypothetical protein